nr:MAG TPA: hypothetical protein [Caudoviricetes sp.]
MQSFSLKREREIRKTDWGHLMKMSDDPNQSLSMSSD